MLVGTGTPQNPVPVTPSVFRTLNQGVVVETVPQAMAELTAQQRPPEANWWMYSLEWQVDFIMVPNIRGMMIYAPGTLVFDANLWESASVMNANPNNPTVSNTFIYKFLSDKASDALTYIRKMIDEYVMYQYFNTRIPAHAIDTTLVTSLDPSYDPLGILPQVMPSNGQAISVTAEWRTK
jgi:hypothetical protein